MKKNDNKVTHEGFLIELNESDVFRLPISGPISRRLFVLAKKGNSQETKELFVQRNDAFSTNLFGLLKSIKSKEIIEIRYSVGLDGLMRIFLNDNEKIQGEYFCKSQNSLFEFKRKMKIH